MNRKYKSIIHFSSYVDEDLNKLNERIARGERNQNMPLAHQGSRVPPLGDDAMEFMESMKSEITEIIWKRLEDDERRTVFDVPLVNGTSTIDLNSLEKSEKDLRSKFLRNIKREKNDQILNKTFTLLSTFFRSSNVLRRNF